MAAIGCGDESSSDGRTKVVTTTTQLGDFARQVGGDRVEVEAILDAKVDPHDYEPRPSDAQAVAEADVVLRSGGAVDAWLDDLVGQAGGDAQVVTLTDEIGVAVEDDPHWWQDPRNVIEAIEVIAAETGGDDRAYAVEVGDLDSRIAECMRAIPAARRKLVTNHDAFGFFAERYGIEVLGSIIPGGSTTSQPSAGDVRRLVEAIRREKVTTIFPESALNQDLEKAVARDSGAKVGPPLYADTLGPEGTYLSALAHDAAAMAEGFGGRCEL